MSKQSTYKPQQVAHKKSNEYGCFAKMFPCAGAKRKPEHSQIAQSKIEPPPPVEKSIIKPPSVIRQPQQPAKEEPIRMSDPNKTRTLSTGLEQIRQASQTQQRSTSKIQRFSVPVASKINLQIPEFTYSSIVHILQQPGRYQEVPL